MEESVRQANARPFVEEAVLQVSDWGFSIGDLDGQSKYKGKGILAWLKSLYTPAEKRLSGFLGPIHLWQVSERRAMMKCYAHSAPGITSLNITNFPCILVLKGNS